MHSHFLRSFLAGLIALYTNLVLLFLCMPWRFDSMNTFSKRDYITCSQLRGFERRHDAGDGWSLWNLTLINRNMPISEALSFKVSDGI